MPKLSKDGVAVLALMAARPLFDPPPLVESVCEDLVLDGLAYRRRGEFHPTLLGRRALEAYGM
ncbi:MAG: hypothetical protein RLZ98_1926 [Pseudomonadota bacterium]|jgi:hypothetical protein